MTIEKVTALMRIDLKSSSKSGLPCTVQADATQPNLDQGPLLCTSNIYYLEHENLNVSIS